MPSFADVINDMYKNIISLILGFPCSEKCEICVTTSSDSSTKKIKYVCYVDRVVYCVRVVYFRSGRSEA